LTGSGVIVQHALESSTDVDSLTSVSYPLLGGKNQRHGLRERAKSVAEGGWR
jgi:hypothetical protein